MTAELVTMSIQSDAVTAQKLNAQRDALMSFVTVAIG